MASAQTTDVSAALAEAEAEIAKIVAIPDGQRTFENTMLALDDVATRLQTKTAFPTFLYNVSTDEATRDASRKAEEEVGAWLIKLGKREDLYRAVKAYAAKGEKLTPERQRLLEFSLRDYRRDGMDLPADKRARLQEIQLELQKKAQQFDQNIYEDDSMVLASDSELAGLPPERFNGLEKISGGQRIVTLDGPTFTAVLENVKDGGVRERVWTAYKRKGGERNIKLLEEVIALRAEMAQMLGYPTFVDYAVETRMAKNAGRIAEFYRELRPVVRKKAQADYDEFVALKRKETRDPKARLMPWDQSYYKAQVLKSRYAVDPAKVAEYFPTDRVFEGLFNVTSSLYGIKFRDVTTDAGRIAIPAWHADVKLWEVTDAKSGNVLGHIYTDLFPRENKYNHAAVWGLVPRKVYADGTLQKPIAALVTNFSPPQGDRPGLMTIDEVETFFHEFGHGLHNLLTETTLGHFAGTSVEQDFVEAPSQMFENWVYEPEVLKGFARHWKTGEPLPAKTLENVRKARTVGSGLEAEHQFYYGLVDQAYHTDPSGKVDTTKVQLELMPQVELYPEPKGTFFQSAFGHLMGYEGAYYGYQWSLVYAADVFRKFQELGVLNPEAGRLWREKVLARGGTVDAEQMLREFLGREPERNAYLEQLGMTPPKR